MFFQVWDAVSGEEELNLQHKHIVKSVNFSDDSVNLATGSNDKIIRIFDLDKSNDGPKVWIWLFTSLNKNYSFSTKRTDINIFVTLNYQSLYFLFRPPLRVTPVALSKSSSTGPTAAGSSRAATTKPSDSGTRFPERKPRRWPTYLFHPKCAI